MPRQPGERAERHGIFAFGRERGHLRAGKVYIWVDNNYWRLLHVFARPHGGGMGWIASRASG